MGIMLANVERLATEAAAVALEPPPPIDYLAWAERNVVITEGSFPGPYNRKLFPYFDEILRALSPDDPCRYVTVQGSAQIGKTTLANIFTCGSITMAKGNFLYAHPTEDNARRWSKMKLAPLMRSTAVVRELFPQKSRDVADSVMYKERRDGLATLLISGANSPASLSQVTIQCQVQDDLAKWEMNAAGDPEVQADNRSRAIEFAKIAKISTPLVMPGCRITRNFEAGSQEMPYVPCPHCGEMQVLEWDNMLASLDPAKPEDAHFTCVACGATIEEHHRPQMLAGFEWRAKNPNARREHRSFWIWSAYSYLQSFSRIAAEWLRARGDPAAEKTFLNDTVGKAYRAQGEARPWEELRDRAAESHYVRGNVPAGALLLMLGIDCQVNRVEWQLVGFGRDYRRYVVDYGIIDRHISDPDCQANLGALLGKQWRNSAGRNLGIDLAAIDGNAWTEDVWSFARKHPSSKLIMVRGRGDDGAPRIARVKRERNEKTGKVLRYSSRFYHLGVSVLKMALYRDLAKDDPLANGFVAFPSGLDDEYFQELTAERRVPIKRKGDRGFTVYRWVKDDRQDNEALDTLIQATGAALKFGVYGLSDVGWGKLEAERETPLQTGQLDLEDLIAAPSVAPKAPPPKPPTRKSIASLLA
ncbi:MAG TPA: terminase gpA endonuclease subunit [Xanthobacteraceae bacterium]|nr:terminase gpA endonuclease subunit [Xanthobacteraceae bacterium]